MDLRYIRYFVVVAEELNFTRAAQRLHIAQPSLWSQVRKLELELGVDLLARKGRGIKLTDAGQVFLELSRKTLADAQYAVVSARQAAHGEIGRLTIGYVTSAEFEVFPQLVPAFRKKFPNIHLDFHDLKTAQILGALDRDELDVGIVWLPIPTADLDVKELTRHPLVLIAPAEHPLAAKANIAIKDLSKEPLILASRELNAESFREIEQLFLKAKAAMNVVYELETTLQIINFVAMGIGCSLLPDYVLNMRRPGVVYKPVRPPNLVKTMAIIKKKHSGAVVDSFLRFTLDNFKPARKASQARA